MTGQVLVTGGRGKTGSRVAARLGAAGTSSVIGARTAPRPNERRFDWADLSSAAAFDGCISAYLVAPTDRTDHLSVMQPMLEHAMERGVRRFVLLSSSLFEPGAPMMGEVHAWLARNVPEWTVLRPSWFMQNFSEGAHGTTIRHEGAIYSATGNGRVGFVDAEDIAAAAVAALTMPNALNADYVLTGPETLSYDDVAAIMSGVMKQPIRHVQLEPARMTARFESQGLSRDYAETLTGLDRALETGVEDRTTDCVERLTGRAPTSFRTFADRIAAVGVQEDPSGLRADSPG